MIVRCTVEPKSTSQSAKNRPAYLLKGDPADARLVVRFPDEDRVVMADEARGLRVSFDEATDEELWILREGGYSIVD